jgi:hypothetical protein
VFPKTVFDFDAVNLSRLCFFLSFSPVYRIVHVLHVHLQRPADLCLVMALPSRMSLMAGLSFGTVYYALFFWSPDVSLCI